MAGTNLRRSGVYNTTGVHQINGLMWKTEVLCRPAERNDYSVPVIVGRVAYFTCGENRSRGNGIGGWDFFADYGLYAIDTGTGKTLWQFKVKQSHLSDIAVAGDVVYVGANEGYFGSKGSVFHALDARTGAPKWSYRIKRHPLAEASPAVADGVLIFIDRKGHLYALDARTGQQKWMFSAKGELSVSAVLGETIYLTSSKGFFYAIDLQTGQQRWESKVGSDLGDPVIFGESAYFGATDGRLYALDLKTGKQTLKARWPGGIDSFFAVADGMIFYGGERDSLYAVEARTGQMKWKFKTGEPCMTPAVADGVVYFPCHDGHLYAADAQTGRQKWKLESKGFTAYTPSIADGALYFAGSDGRVYAVR